MSKNNWLNLTFWLESEQPGTGAEVPAANTTPTSQPDAVGQQQQPPPQPGQDPSASAQPDPNDVTQDPQSIQMPQGQPQGFEQWRHSFFELAVKCDTEEMVTSLNSMREQTDLEAADKRFVDDNFNVFTYRRDATVGKASKEIRNLVKKELDRTNPGTTLMQHVTATLDANPLLYQSLIKLAGTFAWKADLHRKWLAALLGAVQTGGGSAGKDLVYCGNDFDINISTRFAVQWGEINLGKWSLVAGDPKNYLKPDQETMLQDGSPEEKQAVRRRVIMESIAEKYRKRAFLVNVVMADGTIYALGWDMGNSLLDAYKEGKVVVRGTENQEKEILISDEGEIIPVVDYSILLVKETGETDDDGHPETEEVPFIERRDSVLYLVADLDALKTASAGLSGMFFKGVPYSGNPSDIIEIQRSVPGLFEILGKQVV